MRKLVLFNTLIVLGIAATFQQPTYAATATLNPTLGGTQTNYGHTIQTVNYSPTATVSGTRTDCHQFVLHATGLSDYTVSFTSGVGPGTKSVPPFMRTYSNGNYTIYGTASGSNDVTDQSAGYWQADTDSFTLNVF